MVERSKMTNWDKEEKQIERGSFALLVLLSPLLLILWLIMNGVAKEL